MRDFARLALVAVVALAIAPRAVGFQSPQGGTAGSAMVAGQVVDAVTNRPVAGALVRLGPSSSIQYQGGEVAQSVTGTDGARYVLADREGRFRFEQVEARSYVLTTETPGYLISGYQQKDPSSSIPEFTVVAGQRRLDLVVPAWPAGVMTGAVFDEMGEPVVGVQVAVLRETFLYGKRKLDQQVTTRTDDRGVYRVAGLEPGRFVVAVPSTAVTIPAPLLDAYREATAQGNAASTTAVALRLREVSNALRDGGRAGAEDTLLTTRDSRLFPAAARNGGLAVYPTTYHAAATDVAVALAVEVPLGEVRTGIDLHLRSVPAFDVAGRLTHATESTDDVGVELWPASASRLARPGNYEVAVTRTTAGGRFRFVGVPAGSYLLKARKIPVPEQVWVPTPMRVDGRDVIMSVARLVIPDMNAATLWADQVVTVAADSAEIEIPVAHGYRISGRATFEGTGDLPMGAALENSRVDLSAADGSPSEGVFGVTLTADRTFRTLEHPSGRYYVSAFQVSGWRLESAVVNGRDAVRTPFLLTSDIANVELRYSNRPLDLRGTVIQPAAPGERRPARVVAFPKQYEAWIEDGMYPLLSAVASAAEDGTFRLRPRVDGEYMVAAFEPAGHRDPRDPEFIRALARSAVAATVVAGVATSVQVRIATVR